MKFEQSFQITAPSPRAIVTSILTAVFTTAWIYLSPWLRNDITRVPLEYFHIQILAASLQTLLPTCLSYGGGSRAVQAVLSSAVGSAAWFAVIVLFSRYGPSKISGEEPRATIFVQMIAQGVAGEIALASTDPTMPWVFRDVIRGISAGLGGMLYVLVDGFMHNLVFVAGKGYQLFMYLLSSQILGFLAYHTIQRAIAPFSLSIDNLLACLAGGLTRLLIPSATRGKTTDTLIVMTVGSTLDRFLGRSIARAAASRHRGVMASLIRTACRSLVTFIMTIILDYVMSKSVTYYTLSVALMTTLGRAAAVATSELTWLFPAVVRDNALGDAVAGTLGEGVRCLILHRDPLSSMMVAFCDHLVCAILTRTPYLKRLA